MTKDKQFKFYENFMRAIDILPENQRANACYQFCKFGLYGELPDDEMLKMFCIGVSISVQKYQGSGGKREGAGRPKKNNQNNQINQINQIEQTKTKTKTKTETKIKKENLSAQDINYEFDRFYAEYPRKVSKSEAKKKFINIIKKSKDSSIIANIFYGLECYKKSIIANKTETKYIKHPTTWLNQECWKDYEKQEQFTKVDEDRLTTLQEIVLKSPILTEKERLEAEKEVAKLWEKKKQCQ